MDFRTDEAQGGGSKSDFPLSDGSSSTIPEMHTHVATAANMANAIVQAEIKYKNRDLFRKETS